MTPAIAMFLTGLVIAIIPGVVTSSFFGTTWDKYAGRNNKPIYNRWFYGMILTWSVVLLCWIIAVWLGAVGL